MKLKLKQANRFGKVLFTTAFIFLILNFQNCGNFSAQNSSSSASVSTDDKVVILSANHNAVTSANTFTLSQGASVQNGYLRLTLQSDGNLVVYLGTNPLWSTGTFGQNCKPSCVANFQADGNFVLYNGATPYWNSGTENQGATNLVFSQTAPFLRITDANQSIIWASTYSFQNLILRENMAVKKGSTKLVMQSDGNLVVYAGSTPMWSTLTSGQTCSHNCVANFQNDGNIVLYNGTTPYWQSQTAGNYTGLFYVFTSDAPYLQITTSTQYLWTASNSFNSLNIAQNKTLPLGDITLSMQSDGNLVLYHGMHALWSTHTGGPNQCTKGCSAVFQGDGNLVVYNGSAALWNSNTGASSSAQLIVQPKPPYLMIRRNNQIAWSAGTDLYWLSAVDNIGKTGAYGTDRPGSPDFMNLFSSNPTWPVALSHINVFKLYSQSILYSNPNSDAAHDAALAQIFAFLNSHNIALAVEFGVFNAPADNSCGQVEGTGGVSQADQLARKILSLGGNLAYVVPDEPMSFEYYPSGTTGANRGCQLSMTALAANVNQTYQKLKSYFPAVQMGDAEPFGGFPSTWQNDYSQWLKAYKSATGVQFAFFQDDANTVDTQWHSRIKAMQSLLGQNGIPYGIIMNGQAGSSDSIWMANAENQIQSYADPKFGSPPAAPAQVVFQTWDAHPTYVLPETSSTSLTYLVDYYFHFK